ncbi:hypothetical protein [Cohnella cholangitidis]|uniref:Guanylate cyclase domain-containing protein n=1 Tax=Cohnella cholangitidis TaxID=2598458 RepID=A0A7G5BSY7_9BACL|nr:hypothetical protein [Cohnella cholangitidis]QMV40071.1 hypothetical protein FPL14_01800 [Cohnella cholangitidis]
MYSQSNNKKYIAFLDILGFKSIVENNTHERLTQIYNDFSTRLSNQEKFFESIGEMFISETDSPKQVHSVIISDSIIIWTATDTPENFCMLVMAVQFLVISSFEEGIPLRGTINRGDLTIYNSDKGIQVFGKALTEAYSFESIIQLSGCVVTDSCMRYVFERCGNNILLNIMLKNNSLFEYSVPKKSGKVKNHYIVNWVTSVTKEEKILASFSQHDKTTDDWSIQLKINNTIEFMRYVVNQKKVIKGFNNKT